MVLSFDGSFLGSFIFNQHILWYFPSRIQSDNSSIPNIFILMLVNGKVYPLLLRFNAFHRVDQIVVNELKDLFQVSTTGCHRIELDMKPRRMIESEPWITSEGLNNCSFEPRKSEYLIFPHPTHHHKDGSQEFMDFQPLKHIDWCPHQEWEKESWYDEMEDELRRIYLFREICDIHLKEYENIFVYRNPISNRVMFLSDHESFSLEVQDFRLLPDEVEREVFPGLNDRAKIVAQTFGLTKENYNEKMFLLKNRILDVFIKHDPERAYLSNTITQNIVRFVSHYLFNW